MNKTNKKQTSRNALTTALIVGTFGSIAVGCLPPGNPEFARFDTNNYSAVTNRSDLAGTWIFTLNNEYSNPDPRGALYQRDLARFKPVAGAPGSYELKYCDSFRHLTRITVTASGDKISLPITDADYDREYTVTSNGRMSATFMNNVNSSEVTYRAVRISADPDFDAGTVGVDFDSDGAGVVRQPTACFHEYRGVVTGLPFTPQAVIAEGESSSGRVTAHLKDGRPLNTRDIYGTDGVNRLQGEYTNNTFTYDVRGIRGSVKTQGDDNDPNTDTGSLVLDVKL